MLQGIRDNAQSWITKVIVILIIFSFAIFGLESIRLVATNNGVATVNGVDISPQEVQRAMTFQRNQLIQQMGDNFDPSLINEDELRSGAIESLINEQILVQAAEEAGMYVTDQVINEYILQNPSFQVEGKYSKERFQLAISSLGLSPQQFRQYLRQQVLVNQYTIGVSASDFVLDNEINTVLKLDQQTRSIQYLTLQLDKIKAEVKPTEDEIKAYYEANKDDFKTPEQIQVDYVVLDRAKYLEAIEVSDKEVQERYDALVADLEKEAKKRRQVAHILFEINDDLTEEKAKALADEVKQKLANGEDFAKLAKAYSSDKVSAEKGGDLGVVEKGFFGEEFDLALADLKEGEVSEPVKNDFGYQIIKVTGVDKAKIPSIAEKKDEIVKSLKQEKVELAFAEKKEEFGLKAYESDSLTALADEFELAVQTSDYFDANGGKGLFANKALVNEAFSEEVVQDSENSKAIEVDEGKWVVVRLKDRKLAAIKPLDQVTETVKTAITNKQAEEKMNAQVEQLLAQLKEGKTLESVATEAGLELKKAENIKRSAANLPRQLIAESFKMPRPSEDKQSFSQATLLGGNMAIIALNSVKTPEKVKEDGQQKQFIARYLTDQQGRQMTASLQQNLRESAEIERN
ncbi:SurA N-terminal domain-containing protein [Spartinivicinus poritis]|uniref:Periplasmic chaperone PpiD n=1 Tax=Spartinivicinus poritis TaxID=2994640 RepID=A0ABT5U405_9GAMM|nr:SurA N-terminal domain-containing protein [Spartinivicinus sp. A2-2]MDE1461090.1 SurA N-terminal domain-containing protein [Spartinivicinus sp. A2-2]